MESKKKKKDYLCFCIDFDGTAAETGVTAAAIKKFSPEAWDRFEELEHSGKISFRECVVGEFSSLAGKEKEVIEFVKANFTFRKGFSSFLDHCRSKGYSVQIVSESLDFIIEAIMEKAQIRDIPVFCDRFIKNERRETVVDFPYLNSDCNEHGICKANIVKMRREEFEKVIFIGDGSNDICPAKEADLVFARSRLKEYFDKEGLNYYPFEDFNDVKSVVESFS